MQEMFTFKARALKLGGFYNVKVRKVIKFHFIISKIMSSRPEKRL